MTDTLTLTSLHDVILQTWLSAFGSTKVSYLSGPITTGPLFNKWYASRDKNLDEKGLSESKRANVILPNSLKLIEEANRIRLFWPTPVVEPASFFIREWSQEEYLKLWSAFIEKHVDTVLFLPDWESSVGCVTEFSRALEHGKARVTIDGAPIALDRAIKMVASTIEQAILSDASSEEYLERLSTALNSLEAFATPRGAVIQEALQKDESLNVLAELANVAQFVSYRVHEGSPKQSFSRVLGEVPNNIFVDVSDAARELLAKSVDGSVNVRSYAPNDHQSKEFVYGLKNVDEVAQTVSRLTSDGMWTVINETIDIHDGGVSGVYWDDIIEFSPDDTPRAVEKDGICSLPAGMGSRILETVYGFAPELSLPNVGRLEFSLHPTPRGWRNSHTIGWEFSTGSRSGVSPKLSWPNTFSKLIGDKSFGLLVAHEIGLPVPKSLVISRRVAPFSFGRASGTRETWIRTAPFEQDPGMFSTARGWRDPFAILAIEDPQHKQIASVLAQDGVLPRFSGASIILKDGSIQTEGVAGAGDNFMLGGASPQSLPVHVKKMVEDIHQQAKLLGPVRFEWVFDGKIVWVVQFHRGQTDSLDNAVVAGEADRWQKFDPSEGLTALREFLAKLPDNSGLILTKRIGLTSHIADVIRKAGRPARVQS